MTSYPRRRSTRAPWRPIHPAPPTTRIAINVLSRLVAWQTILGAKREPGFRFHKITDGAAAQVGSRRRAYRYCTGAHAQILGTSGTVGRYSRQRCWDARAPGTCAQFADEFGDFGEVIAIVSVPHDDETSARGMDPGTQSGAVSPFADTDDACSEAFGDFDGAVGCKGAERFFNTETKRLGFIEARNDDGNLNSALSGGRFEQADGRRSFHCIHKCVAPCAPFARLGTRAGN